MFEKCLYFNSNALSRRLTKVWENAYKETGLTAAQAYVLRLICEHPDLNQRQIADELLLDKSTVTRFIDRLVIQGFVIRDSSEDNRERRLLATEQGKTLGVQLADIGKRLYNDLQNKLGQQDFDNLVVQMRHSLKKLG